MWRGRAGEAHSIPPASSRTPGHCPAPAMRLVPRPGRRLQPLRRVSPATPVRSLAPSPAGEPPPISAGARLTCHAPSSGCGGARPAPRGGPRPMGRDGRSRVRSGPAAGHGDSRDTAPPAHPVRSLRALAAVHAGSRWPPGWSSYPRPSEGRMRRRRGGGQLVRGGPGGSMLSPQRGKGHRPAPCGCGRAGARARRREKTGGMLVTRKRTAQVRPHCGCPW